MTVRPYLAMTTDIYTVSNAIEETYLQDKKQCQNCGSRILWVAVANLIVQFQEQNKLCQNYHKQNNSVNGTLDETS